jgi:predicted ATPase
MEIINAIDYLNKKKMFQDKEYEWIYPFIKGTMKGCQITKQLIDEHIYGKFDLELTPSGVTVEKIDPVFRIMEISEIKNVGLVEISDKPLKFNEGLNIIYGKNGSGKSTIYRSLINTLGNKHIQSQPNIHNGEESVSVKIKVMDSANNEDTIEYSGEEQLETSVRVYDTKKMDFLIEPKREQFEIPILNQEVFNHLRSLFDMYTGSLDQKIGETNRRIAEIRTNFDDEFALFGNSTQEIKKVLDENQFSVDNEASLSEKIKEKEGMSVDKIELEKTVLTTANNYIKDILCKFGNINSDEGKTEYKLVCTTDEIKKYHLLLDEFNQLNEIVNAESIEGFKQYIDGKWIGNTKWKAFIISGLDFVATLDKNPEKCPYCHQALGGESKELLEKYKTLKSDAGERLKVLEKSIESSQTRFKRYQDNITECNDLIGKLNELEGYEFQSNFNIGVTRQDMENISSQIGSKKTVSIEQQSFMKLLETQMNVLSIIYKENKESIIAKKGSIKTLEESKKSIQKQIDVLEKRKLIKMKSDLISEYIELSDLKNKYDEKKSDLRNLKTKNSQTQNQFSKESYIQLYQEQIKKEYEALEQEQVIKPVYKPQKDECVCAINSIKGSFKISDIFSEGEIRIHSLAELFAEATLTDYKGIYIFDDPVNSLDETNIDYVARRIKKLVENGNQVIIFTHNILFLNELVEVEKEPVINIEKYQYGLNPDETSIIIENNAFNERALKIKENRLKRLMSEIEELREKLDLVEMRGKIAYMYSEMSGYLEDYFEKKMLRGIITRHRNNIRMHSVITLTDLNKDGQLEKLNELYEKTSKFCNRHSQTLSQKKADYKDIMIDFPEFKDFVGWK